MDATWILWPFEWQRTEARLRKLVNRMVQKGLAGSLEWSAVEIEATSDHGSPVPLAPNHGKPREAVRRAVRVTVTGTLPKYEGWTFRARVDWDTEAGMLIHTVPGNEEFIRPDSIRGRACDHCHHNRQRKSVYLVRHDDGRELQVGSTCLKDFLGRGFIPSMSIVTTKDIDDMMEDGPTESGIETFPIEAVLTTAWAAIRKFGWSPAGSENSTKETVRAALMPHSKADEELCQALEPLREECKGAGERIRAWVLSDDFPSNSNYALNLKAACAPDWASENTVGLLVSAPAAHARHEERSLNRQREQSELVNDWFGAVKDKVTIRVQVKSVRYIHGTYGTTSLYTMVGHDGPEKGMVFKWFSSNGALDSLIDESETGNPVITLKGTVKDHDMWKDQKQTVLTRCKLGD